MTSASLVDLRAARAAARVVLPRTRDSAEEAAALRAAVADELPGIDAAAREWTQLGAELPPTTARVIGRLGWVDLNLAVLDGVSASIARRLPPQPQAARVAASVQLGTLLGLLSTRVLGQFVLPLVGDGGGQLVVVGPNVLDLGRRSPDVADDLRRTVLLHEVAHRLQFDAVPWLGEHLRGLVGSYLDRAPTDATAILRIVQRLPEGIAEALRGGGVQALVEVVLTEDQREVLDRAQALMSLLEGHGNATMHLATPGVVDDPDRVQEAMAERRGDLTAVLLRNVVGMSRKERQYSEGEAFVRAVVDHGGVARLNRAFDGPDALPKPGEIADPEAWIDRTAA